MKYAKVSGFKVLLKVVLEYPGCIICETKKEYTTNILLNFPLSNKSSLISVPIDRVIRILEKEKI